jgi:3-deoxy-7-phosphoheptulonate synthase
MIEPMSLAAIAAGVDGLEIEVHIDPPSALSDKDQQLRPEEFAAMMKRLTELREFMAERAEGAVAKEGPADPKKPRDVFADAMD